MNDSPAPPDSKSEARTPSQGRLLLLLANATEALGPLARSVALAHLIAPFDFGIAISVSTTLGMAEMLFDIGLEQSSIRMAGAASDVSVLSTLHTLSVIRGVVIGILIFTFGAHIAELFNSKNAALEFSALGANFIVSGCNNLGNKQATRHYAFGPLAKSIICAQIAWTVITIGSAVLTHSYICMLFGIFAYSIAYFVASHALSDFPWRLGWSNDVAWSAIRFGLPLLPNGAILAITTLGDRFIVGSLLSPVSLALYSATIAAALLPRGVILRFLSAQIMPIFINEHSKGPIERETFDAWMVLLCGIGFFYGLGFLSFGKPLLSVVFGRVYAPEELFVSAIAVGIWLKFLVALPVIPAVTSGATHLILFTSGLSIGSLALGSLVLWKTGSLTAYAVGVASGDIVVVLLIFWISISSFNFSPRSAWTMLFVTFFLLASAAIVLRFSSMSLFARMSIATAFGSIYLVVFVLWFPVSRRRYLSSFFGRFGESLFRWLRLL